MYHDSVEMGVINLDEKNKPNNNNNNKQSSQQSNLHISETTAAYHYTRERSRDDLVAAA